MAASQHPRHQALANWTPLLALEGVFGAEDCGRILALRQEMKEGEIRSLAGQGRGEAVLDAETAGYRSSRVCWLRPDAGNQWLFGKLWQACQQVNRDYFQAELSGFTEPLQIAEYGPGQYYDWHLDFGPKGLSVRKLSFVVQLSDPAAYEGGALEIMASRERFAAPRAQGSLILFPSFVLHRVAEVTRGNRWSLVGWIGGPPYR